MEFCWPPPHTNSSQPPKNEHLRSFLKISSRLHNCHPTALEIRHLRSFFEVMGVHWPPTQPPRMEPPPPCRHHHPRNRAFALIFGGCGLPLATTTTATTDLPYPQNRAFALVFGGCELPLATTTDLLQHSRSLWASPGHQHPRIECECSFSGVVGLNSKIEHVRACFAVRFYYSIWHCIT